MRLQYLRLRWDGDGSLSTLGAARVMTNGEDICLDCGEMFAGGARLIVLCLGDGDTSRDGV